MTTDKSASSESETLEAVALDATHLKCSQPAAEGAAPAPERLLIVPWGRVQSAAGDFTVDDESAALAIAAFERHGADLPLDYEHQTLGGAHASPDGRAPAAGWVTALHAVAPGGDSRPGIWADVTWTDDGRRHVTSRQYRYLSPVALVRRRDRKLVALHSVALTNKPAIAGMVPVVNDASRGAADVPDLTPLRNALQLDDHADAVAVVSRAVCRLQALESADRQRDASARVERACREGKLAAAQHDWAMRLALKNPGEFDSWLECAPVVVPLGRIDPVAPPHAAALGVERAARAEWHAHRDVLERLCTEDAYAAAALRDAQ